MFKFVVLIVGELAVAGLCVVFPEQLGDRIGLLMFLTWLAWAAWI